jgi:N-acetyl sugar amidotransferase
VSDTKYGLPSEVIYCKKCVISNQRPITLVEVKHGKNTKKETTAFKDGVCDACRWAEMKKNEIDWASRELELIELLNRHRSNDGEYDVIVPVSGGKDSNYVAHLLKEKYGMNPLTITWAPHIYTNPGWDNLQSFIESGFDNILSTPNGKVQRLFTKLAFLNLGHPFQPFTMGQRVIAPNYAVKNKIKLSFYGENVGEYGNKIEDNFRPTMYKSWFTDFNIDNEEIMFGGVSIKELKEHYGLKRRDFLPYQSPSIDSVTKLGLEQHYMSYYIKWVPQENFYYAKKHTMFEPNPQRTPGTYSRYSSFDDKIDFLHYYCMLIKFGMGRATWDAAQEIRSGKITRDEGVALVHKYDTEFPTEFLNDWLEYMSITEEEFFGAIEKFRSPHLWNKVNGKWELSHPVK